MRNVDLERSSVLSGQASGHRLEAASFGNGVRAAVLMFLATAGCGGGAERSVSDEQVRTALEEIEGRVRSQVDFGKKTQEQQGFEIKRAVVLEIVAAASRSEQGERLGGIGLQQAVRLAEPNSVLGRAIQEFDPTTAVRAAIDHTAHSSGGTVLPKGAARALTAVDSSTPRNDPVTPGQSKAASTPVPAQAQDKEESSLDYVLAAARWVVEMPETCVDGVKSIAVDTGWTVGACSLTPLIGPVPCVGMTGELLKTTALTAVQCLLEGVKGTPGIPKPVSKEELLRLPASCLDGASDIARETVLTITKCTLAGASVPGSASSCREEAIEWTITIGKGAVVCLNEAAREPEVKRQVPPPPRPRPAPKEHNELDAGRTFRETMMGRTSDRPAPEPRERPAPPPRERPAPQPVEVAPRIRG